MKKFLSLIIFGGFLFGNSFGAVANRKKELVSIDSLVLMQKSKEGKALAEKLQKDIKGFQEEVQKAQQKVVGLQETIQKQAKVLSKEALMEKGEELTTMKKRAERDLADKEESLKMKVQKQQGLLRDKQLKTAKKIFDKKGWGMMIDKNTPGVLFVNQAIDKTDEILKIIDSEYDQQTAKNIVSKASGKKNT
ncbi:hypothetical protein GF385_02265 [Candidatus Dependentiae bacterium]|nr:hypothetical protein [Candidatus Dependentiae bacterium]